jgi:hypothetical protein
MVQQIYQKKFEFLETWYWSRMEKISWTGPVKKNEEAQLTVKEERNILYTVKKKKG